MKKSIVSMMAILLLSFGAFSTVELMPSAHAVQNGLELHLFAPATASPGQVIAIELWTIFENATSNASDLAFNNTSVVGNTSISFSPKTNVGVVPPHVHTPTGQFVILPAFNLWVHKGAWNTSYTVPSQLGLYGVHVYANYTVTRPGGPNPITHYVAQAETTFLVQGSLATTSDISGLASNSTVYAILGLVVVAVVLDLLLLFWKRSPVKP